MHSSKTFKYKKQFMKAIDKKTCNSKINNSLENFFFL